MSDQAASPGSPDDCPTRRAIALIKDRWSTRLLSSLVEGPLGFNEIQRRLERVSAKVLAQTLRRQEAAGTLSRTQFETVPPTVEYALTSFGRSVLEQIYEFKGWAEAHSGDLDISL